MENCIVQNLDIYGISLDNYTSYKHIIFAEYSVNTIKNNIIRNIWDSNDPGYGIGILIHYNAYSKIENNIIERVRQGIQLNLFGTQNKTLLGEATIVNNTIVSRRVGLWINQLENFSFNFLVENNQVSLSNGAEISKLYGIQVTSSSAEMELIIKNNMVDGYAAGLVAWNNRQTFSLQFASNNVSNCEVGVLSTSNHGQYGLGNNSHALEVKSNTFINEVNTKYKIINNSSSAHLQFKGAKANEIEISGSGEITILD